MVFALILVVKLKRIVGDLRVHGGTGENRVVRNEMLLGLRDEREEAIQILRGGMAFRLVLNRCAWLSSLGVWGALLVWGGSATDWRSALLVSWFMRWVSI